MALQPPNGDLGQILFWKQFIFSERVQQLTVIELDLMFFHCFSVCPAVPKLPPISFYILSLGKVEQCQDQARKHSCSCQKAEQETVVKLQAAYRSRGCQILCQKFFRCILLKSVRSLWLPKKPFLSWFWCCILYSLFQFPTPCPWWNFLCFTGKKDKPEAPR